MTVVAAVAKDGGTPGIIKQLNRKPMGALNYALPVEALKKFYGSAT